MAFKLIFFEFVQEFLEFWYIVESEQSGEARSPSLRVVELVVVLCVALRRRRFPVDGRRDVAAAAVLVVVGQRQVQQAGAGGQVDVLHVIHLQPTHGTQLKETKY